jgi:hypothetical protein
MKKARQLLTLPKVNNSTLTESNEISEKNSKKIIRMINKIKEDINKHLSQYLENKNVLMKQDNVRYEREIQQNIEILKTSN